MNIILLLSLVVVGLFAGSVLGYLARQSIARKKAGSIEQVLQKRIEEVKKEAAQIISQGEEKANSLVEKTKKDLETQRRGIFNTESLLLKRESILVQRIASFEEQEKEIGKRSDQLKEVEANLEKFRLEAVRNLEKAASMTREQAKEELLKSIEQVYEKDILERLRKLEAEGIDKYEVRAKNILAWAMQKYALSQAQEVTTTTVNLPSDEIKGRIIGKEGRNIKALEKLTGVEIIVDDTPEAVIISSFNPIRRQIARLALEKLVQDGRIQPARIEEMVQKAEGEIAKQVKDAGEKAVYDAEILDLDPKLVQILGRLRFRTSYGQNVLAHSVEVAMLAGAIAAEIGADIKVAKKGGLLHDIGKALDHQIEGSHVDIGIKILQKFSVDQAIIDAMKSHHEEYPVERIEAVIVKIADQLSGARPGARKDTVENYLRRLEDLENIALSFPGVEKAYAIQAGREIRVLVKPHDVDDLQARKIARDTADRIQQELKYPGEIKVTVIRESRAVEYAK